MIACFNPLLAEESRRKRHELVEAAEKELQKIVNQVQRRSTRPLKASEIALKVGKVIHRYNVGKHFILTIQDGVFQWRRRLQLWGHQYLVSKKAGTNSLGDRRRRS